MYFLSSVRPSALPQGLFSPPKIYLLYFFHAESLSLCPKYLTHVLPKLGAPGCAPAGAFCTRESNTSQLKVNISHKMYVILGVFEGDITFDGRFTAT